MAEDGSVIIRVSFETGDVDRGVGEIEAGCRRAGEAASQMGRTVARLRLSRPMQTAGRAAGALSGGMEELARQAQGVHTQQLERQLDTVGEGAASTARGLDAAGLTLAALGAAAAGNAGRLVRCGVEVQALSALCAGLGRTLRQGMESLALCDRQAAASLGQLRGALSGVKAALVTAFAPIATAVAPSLSRLCSMLVTAANYVAMFFAVLGGRSTYKRAVAGTASAAAGISAVGAAAGSASGGVAVLGGAVKAASAETVQFGAQTASAVSKVSTAAETAADGIRTIGKAAKDAQRNLSGLDEMNIWKVKEQSASSGSGGGGTGGAGGGGGAGLDIQDGGIDFEQTPIDPAFTEKIGWLREHLDGILTAAAAIGAALLGWRISRALGADLQTALGLAAALGGAVLTARGYLDAWENGIDLTNLRQTFGGLALVIGGVGLAAGPAAAAVAALIGGLGAGVLALREWIKTGQLTREGLIGLEGALLLVGGALSLLTGSWIPAAAAGVAGVAAAVAARWDDIKQATIRTWTDVRAQIAGRWDEIKQAVREKAGAVWERVSTVFGDVRDRIESTAGQAVAAVAGRFEQIRQSIHDKLTGAWQTVTGVFEAIRSAVAEKLESARQAVRTAVEAIKGLFDFDWSLPHIKLPHFSIKGSFSLWPPSIPTVSVSWYARGGIVDGATLIGAGEAGREAIIPLERHTEWIDAVARRLAGMLGAAERSEGLREAADRLGELAASIDRLGLALTDMPAPVLAAGTVIPPRALYTDGSVQGLGDADRRLQQLLAGIGAAQSGQNARYTFIGQIDRKVLFQQVLDEAQLRRSRNGRNPFELGG